jgi:hypothetical protein
MAEKLGWYWYEKIGIVDPNFVVTATIPSLAVSKAVSGGTVWYGFQLLGNENTSFYRSVTEMIEHIDFEELKKRMIEALHEASPDTRQQD